MKKICWYLQGTKYKVLMFNPSNKMVVYFYVDADFAELWEHKNIQDPICTRSINGFAVIFEKFTLLWVSFLSLSPVTVTK